jgi:hypothetical protein
MSDKQWLDTVARTALVYNDSRPHRDFQADEVLKFVEWLHRQYGYEYTKPAPTSKIVDNK